MPSREELSEKETCLKTCLEMLIDKYEGRLVILKDREPRKEHYDILISQGKLVAVDGVEMVDFDWEEYSKHYDDTEMWKGVGFGDTNRRKPGVARRVQILKEWGMEVQFVEDLENLGKGVEGEVIVLGGSNPDENVSRRAEVLLEAGARLVIVDEALCFWEAVGEAEPLV